jgi:hypothetical protein
VDEVTFTFGHLSPDSGIPNEDWTAFDPPKEVTHFLHKGQDEDEIHDLLYYRQYLADVNPDDNRKLYSFRLGYFFHLICDILWAKRVFAATQAQFKTSFEKDEKEAVGLVKGDWYGLDQLYVRAHPEHIFWRIVMEHPFPPSYLPFVQDHALHRQFEYIRKFYSEQEDNWFLSIPYHYLSEETMSRIVDDSIYAILIVHKKLQELGDLGGMESSVALLPKYLIEPYPGPLGN